MLAGITISRLGYPSRVVYTVCQGFFFWAALIVSSIHLSLNMMDQDFAKRYVVLVARLKGTSTPDRKVCEEVMKVGGFDSICKP